MLNKGNMDLILAPSFTQLCTFSPSKTRKSNTKTITKSKKNTFHITECNVAKVANAHKKFDTTISISYTFSWNKIIQTYLKNGDSKQAILTYEKMLVLGVKLDKHTIARVLTACRVSNSLVLGKQVHCHELKLGLCSDGYIFTALLELYGCFEGVEMAKWLFDKSPCELKSSAIAWTMLAKLYVNENKPLLAINLFNVMVESKAAEVDSVALATVIGASGKLKLLKEGKKCHQIARVWGLVFDVLVCNSLLKMYLDCESLEDARLVFDYMPSKDVISWTEMLRGYVKKGGFNEGLKLFREMVTVEGLKPDPLAISSVLPACARVAAHNNGREIHCYMLRNGIDLNIKVLNAVTDMYVKSGYIDYASRIFSRMNGKDAISYTVMIMGYSLHGYGDIGVKMFHEMKNSSFIEIDEALYVAVIYACCTANLVDDGKFCFNKIQSPTVAHCALMVALLASSGLFEEATAFIEKRNLSREVDVLRALLDGCRIRKNISMGKRITEQLLDLEPLNAENYVLLSNWYAHNSKWDLVDEMKETVKDMGLETKKAYSWIEFRNKVHVFGTGDVSHPRSEKIYWELQSLMEKLADQGLKPCTNFSLHDVDEERECVPVGHSELLVVSFGIISTQAGSSIHVTKNSHLCHSCHDSLRLISNVINREIIVKDVTSFHHFKDGICSCKVF